MSNNSRKPDDDNRFIGCALIACIALIIIIYLAGIPDGSGKCF